MLNYQLKRRMKQIFLHYLKEFECRTDESAVQFVGTFGRLIGR